MVGLRPLVERVRFFFLSDALFLINRLMLPAEASRAYNVAVPVRMMLWQHVDDLRPLSDSIKKKWPAHAKARTWDTELVCLTASH